MKFGTVKMSRVGAVLQTFLGSKSLINFTRNIEPKIHQFQQIRNVWHPVPVPKPGVKGKSYRRIVHYEKEYTVKPLDVTNLAGRDPATGRKVVIGVGGGIKHKFHQIKWDRDGPSDLNIPPKEEKVLDIIEDGCRTSHVALVGTGKEVKWILATVNMKKGDILKTHKGIPRIPVLANEGDAYPLGALQVGTKVCCVEKYAGLHASLVHAAGTCATILRKEGDDVVLKMPSKKEFILNKHCMATVGRISNPDHGSTPIGSAQRLRELGNRPRSGLWHRKTGKHGRKIRPPKPPKLHVFKPKSDRIEQRQLRLPGYPIYTRVKVDGYMKRIY